MNSRRPRSVADYSRAARRRKLILLFPVSVLAIATTIALCDLRDNPTYAVLIAKRTELQGQRDTLINRQELTDTHPRVLAIKDQIAAINRQIEELRQQDAGLGSQSPEARELAALESERSGLKSISTLPAPSWCEDRPTQRFKLRRPSTCLCAGAPPRLN